MRGTVLAAFCGSDVCDLVEEYRVVVAGKGGDVVAEVPDELEIERLRNLVSGFGWVVSKVELKTDRIILTVELEREPKEGVETAGPT